ncbi:DNA translocase FtsK [Listeria aquatica]|uniref:DNA translocase FtsK n=2 Tax=Listeria aquatica TaxID=1494960 RepID=A0A841ZL45_9LIST|nr:DNA translocase FtsK [Listeria aquatica]MBC1520956.1 DNA translocase FtsK [Listeria aquatica]
MGWLKNFFFGDMEMEEERKTEVKARTKEVQQDVPKLVRQNQTIPAKKDNKLTKTSQATKRTVARKTVETKMAYEYPKGQFRFPLIPDGDERTEPKKSVAMGSKEVKVKAKKEVAEAKQPEIKKAPFTPTEVPSPVFAFQRRPSRFEFNLDENSVQNEAEVKQIHLITEEAQAPVMEQKNLKTDTAPKFQVQELDDSASTMIETPQANESQSIAEEELGSSEVFVQESAEWINSNSESQDGLLKEAVEAKEETDSFPEAWSNTEKSTEDSIVPEEKTESKKEVKKSHIPFNVLMVNQDHQKDAKNSGPEEQTRQVRSSDEERLSEERNMGSYHFPPLDLLNPPVISSHDKEWLDQEEVLLNETLQNFNVAAHVVGRTQGPAVTRFEVQPEKGVKVSKITNLSDDIKLNLAAKDIRIEAPIPGKSTVGIEIPNPVSRPVMLSEIMKKSIFQDNPSPLTAALGLDISGEAIATDLQKMPHGLIAGATGSGKSVCINSLLVSLLYKARPDELKLLLIDPKMVELAPYNKIPHLVSPVITDAKAATAALKWAVTEMERRYELFSHTSVRNIEKYNELASRPGHSGEKLPYILIVIDELADLMMVAPNDVEESISRIAQKARACGIHMIVATQRPSVDVITGLIKANIPTRISFSVSSSIDSRTILDSSGAEKLLGRGDMLFLPSGVSKPVRLQGTFVSDEEIDAVVRFVRKQGEPHYMFQEEDLAKEVLREDEDELFSAACDFVMEQNAASTSLLQRHFRIGYNRAARLMESLERQKIVSATNGSKPRDVIITRDQLEKLRGNDSGI